MHRAGWCALYGWGLSTCWWRLRRRWAGCGMLCRGRSVWSPGRRCNCRALLGGALAGAGKPQRGQHRAVGSYQVTLALGGWLPVRTIRAVVTERPTVTVCGTPFGVKMFSEGASWWDFRM